MSKIKIGDKVIVKATNNVGTVISRELTRLDGKKVKVEYVVKTGDGFESYKAFDRKEIKRVPTQANIAEVGTYPRIYVHEHKCADGRTLQLVGVVDTFHEYSFAALKSVKKKYLSIGYAICHPSDDNNGDIGANIALARAYDKPLAYLETPFTGEFRKDFVIAILQSKAKFVEENIERFIERDKN